MQNFLSDNSKVIAVDFDGTIVEHKYPAIGKEMLFAFATLKELQKKGHKLILWTIRTGELLEEAVDFCRQNGVEFYAVNKNYPEEVLDQNTSPHPSHRIPQWFQILIFQSPQSDFWIKLERMSDHILHYFSSSYQ